MRISIDQSFPTCFTPWSFCKLSRSAHTRARDVGRSTSFPGPIEGVGWETDNEVASFVRIGCRLGTVCESSASETVKTRVILPLLYDARIQTGCISCNISRGQNFVPATDHFRKNRHVANWHWQILASGPCDMFPSVCRPCRNSEKEYLFL